MAKTRINCDQNAISLCYNRVQGGMRMFTITPAKAASMLKKIACPECGEKVPRVGLLLGSKIKGLTFRCRKCGRLWEVKTE